MQVKKTNAMIKGCKPKKEGTDDDLVMVTEIAAEFVVERSVFDDIVGARGSVSDQFFTKDLEDTRLNELCPITFHRQIEDLRLKIHYGVGKPMTFEPCKVMSNAKFTPVPGGYMEVNCKFKVYPTPTQAGKLDQLVRLWVEIEVEELTEDAVGKD